MSLRFLFSVIFFLSLNVTADDKIRWPKEHFKEKSLNRRVFARLQNYMEIVKSKSPIKITRNGFQVFHARRNYLLVKASYKVSGNMTYLVYKSRNQKFIIKVQNSDLKTAEELLHFNFSSLLNREEFYMEFSSADFALRKSKNESNVLMEYLFSWGNLNLLEKEAPYRLHSKLWMFCSECSGESLSFTLIKDGEQLKKYYFMGELQQKVGPKKFYQIANKWYLPSITESVESVINKLQTRYGWPSER